jgi:hypothetical protein
MLGWALAYRLLARDERRLRDVDQRGQAAVQQGDLDLLAVAGPIPAMKRSQDRHRGVHAGQHVHERDPDLHRLYVTRGLHQPTLGLDDEVIARALARLPV